MRICGFLVFVRVFAADEQDSKSLVLQGLQKGSLNFEKKKNEVEPLDKGQSAKHTICQFDSKCITGSSTNLLV